MSFVELGLAEPIVRAVLAEGYTTPTPIQLQTIPHVLAGRDVLGCAQTGTGKTAAFALPILQGIDTHRRPAHPRMPRVVVLAPTRELAAQIGQSFATYGRNLKFRHAVIFGGVGQGPQVRALAHGVHVLVATPGRLMDLMQQGHLRLDQLEVFVVDEADRMMDMGFLPALKKIISHLPARRQSLFFSATMPPNIAALANSLLHQPVEVSVTPPATTVDLIQQQVMFVDGGHKKTLLQQVVSDPACHRALVFTRTKHGADKVSRQLTQQGISADAIHGNKSQNARERALLKFKNGSLHVLVATDVAARGIDVDNISHVINYDLPTDPESYVHRIGRTGRAGASGIAISFCDSTQRGALRDIEKITRRKIPVAGVQHRAETGGAASNGAENHTAGNANQRHGHQPHGSFGGRNRRPAKSKSNFRRHANRPTGLPQNGSRSAGGQPSHNQAGNGQALGGQGQNGQAKNSQAAPAANGQAAGRPAQGPGKFAGAKKSRNNRRFGKKRLASSWL